MSHLAMATTRLTDVDAKLYRLYAVGALSYEDALEMAQSVFHLRRAMLEFDQNACMQRPPSPASITPRA